jgi:hypothetical protein
MATVHQTEGDMIVRGNFRATGTATLGDGSIDDDAVAVDAGIQATKLQHQHRAKFAQPNSAATTETKVIHVVKGATGIVNEFKAGSIAVAVGNSTVTLDLKKNGVSMLTGVITLDNANTVYIVEAGTLSSTALVAGDVLTVVAVATIGTGTLPTGVFAYADIYEDAE